MGYNIMMKFILTILTVVSLAALSSGKEMSSKTINVPRDKKTVQAAMAYAQSGDTILLAPGKYQEAVVFKSGVTLAGTDKRSCVITPAPGAVAVISAFNCKSGTIKNLTINGKRENKKLFSLGIGWNRKGCDYIIENISKNSPASRAKLPLGAKFVSINNFTSFKSLFYVLAQGGKSSQVKLVLSVAGEKKTFSLKTQLLKRQGHWLSGIFLLNSSININNCIVRNCLGDCNSGGIIVSGNGKSNITDNICYKNQYGIVFTDGAQGTVRNNICKENNYSGIAFVQRSCGIITHNICSKNKASGIFIHGKRTRVEVNENICKNNNSQGISFASGASGTITDNTCSQNQGSGITLASSAKALIIKNKCNKNTFMGIWIVGKGTRAEINKNICNQNNSNGIALDYGAKGIVKNNTCNKNKISGIYFASKDKKKKKGNYSELALNSRESEIANNNVCNKNKHYGIKLSAPAVKKKPVIRVPADKGTIQAAMNSAKVGELILLAPGKYKETIIFKSGVTLAGEDKSLCIIIPVPGATALINASNCKSGTIENITIDGTGKEDKYLLSLEMLHGKKYFGNVVKSFFDYLITIHTNISIDTKFADESTSLGSFLYVLAQQKNKLQFAAPKKPKERGINGIALRNSSINIDNCIVRNCISDCAKNIDDCIVHNCIKDRTGCGIIASGKGKSNITNNICYDNQFGITFIKGARGTVNNNICNENNYSGIAFASKSSGIVTNNICNRNEASGIFISGKKTQVKINKNICLQNNDRGISLVYGASGTITDNICKQNKGTGIAFDEAASPSISNNRCSKNYFAGIFIAGEWTSPSIINNTCNDNTYGIYRYKGSKIAINKSKNSALRNIKENFRLN
jgi:parallel beta-helix repeat protein